MTSPTSQYLARNFCLNVIHSRLFYFFTIAQRICTVKRVLIYFLVFNYNLVLKFCLRLLVLRYQSGILFLFYRFRAKTKYLLSLLLERAIPILLQSNCMSSKKLIYNTHNLILNFSVALASTIFRRFHCKCYYDMVDCCFCFNSYELVR